LWPTKDLAITSSTGRLIEEPQLDYLIAFGENIKATAVDGEIRAATAWVGEDGRIRQSAAPDGIHPVLPDFWMRARLSVATGATTIRTWFRQGKLLPDIRNGSALVTGDEPHRYLTAYVW
jgi:hypothetical protein